MKKIILSALLLLLMAAAVQAQDRFFTKTGKISFYSSTPIEDIEAHNKTTTSVIDTKSGKMEFAVLMKAFQFEKALMEEHFNENYVESSKFPKANFSGTITNLGDVDFKKDGTYKVNVKGNLTLHGVTKPIEVPGTITVKNGEVNAVSTFNVSPEDYNISIPNLVREKIAKQIKVSVDINYEPLKS